MDYCSTESRCQKPNTIVVDDEKFCLNCFQSFKISDEKPINIKINKYNCCENPNIIFGDLNDICISCGAIHTKIINELPYLEDDQYQTNVMYTSKKIHIPYKYLKKIYPEIKYERVYDFLLNSIQIIQDHYKLQRKPYTKYTPVLYNFYREIYPEIPVIENFKNNDIVLDKQIVNQLYKLLNIETNITSNYIKTNEKDNKPIIDDETILKKYYYFNKTKNKYFKKIKYCNYNKCFKIGNCKNEKTGKNYCKEHSDNNKININNKTISKKCNYNNCKKNTIDKYCQNYKFKCIDNDCNTRIMKTDSYCKIHR